MADLNREALEVWNSLKPMIDKEITDKTQGAVQRRKAKVTTAPSLVTNTIGVTEAFGQEIFLPFVTNIASAVVGDLVWIEWMYGASNAFVSSFAEVDKKDFTVARNLTVGGVLDVTPRRCYATLSTPGWYRVLTYNAESAAEALSNLGRVFDFTITRTFSTSSNEVHKISLLNPYNAAAFIGEESYSHVLLIDKIRATINSTDFKFNVDIHYVGTYVNRVTVDFVMHTEPTAQANCVATGLVGVADSPNNETELTPYTFVANTPVRRTYVGSLNASSSISFPYSTCATVKAARGANSTTFVDAIADTWGGVSYSSRNDNFATVSASGGNVTLTNVTGGVMNYIVETF